MASHGVFPQTDLEKQLISKVYEHDFLYAIDAVHYRDRHMRAMAWTEIGKELGLPASQCKDMWRKLRNCYLNAINRRQGKNIPKWKYEDEMSFLLPFIEIRSSENDTELHSQSSSLSNVSVSYNEGNVDNSMFSEREDSPEMILPGTSNSLVPKKEPEDELPEVLLVPKRKLNFRRDRLVERPASNTVHDETEMFFMSISQTVKRLPPIDQAKIKMELCKQVYEAEIRQLESQSGSS